MTLTLSEQIQHCTIRIETVLKNGSTSIGTGFFFNFLEQEDGTYVPAIVTNKHVIKDSVEGKFRFTVKRAGNPDYCNSKEYQISNFEQKWIEHPNPNIDLCAMTIGELFNMALLDNVNLFYIGLTKSLILSDDESKHLNALEVITMVGYPNGLWDSVNNLPILRRGITATHPNLDYMGKEEFMIDAACFPGSSGSPVLQLDEGGYKVKNQFVSGSRLKLLGVLYAGPQHTATGDIEIVDIPTRSESIIKTKIMMNLGIIIKAKKILELEREIKKVLNM